jgi:N-acetylglucosamine-6-phosphate deacetylase
MTIVVAGNLVLDDDVRPGAIVVEDGIIARIVYDTIPNGALQAYFVAPGLIDVQVNGGFGFDVAEPGGAREIARRLPETGVTAFLPTVISSPPELYERLPDELEAASACLGAIPLGLHVEGPLLAPSRAGAHPRDVIERADLDCLLPLIERDALRMVTLAPERPKALGWIQSLTTYGVVCSIGHTDCDEPTFRAAVDAGATCVTHLYNAMSPFHHRVPGAVGAALDDDRVTVGLVADGVHCHPIAMRLAWRAKGPERMLLATDAVAAAGSGPGRYRLSTQDIIVDESAARLADGTLAGSTLTLDRAVREIAANTGATADEALRMASTVPARVLGLAHKGRLAVGCDADLTLLDEALGVVTTIVGGRVAFRRSSHALA